MSDGMNPRQWFVLGIRLFGVWLLIEGVGFVANFLDLRLGLGLVPETGRPAGYLLYAAFDFALAAFFLLAPGKLASWCEAADDGDVASDGDVADDGQGTEPEPEEPA